MSDIAAIVIKQKAHQQDSETYGWRQHTKVIDDYGNVTKRSERDSQNLRSAVDSNWKALSKELVDKYGLPESEVEPMRVRIYELNKAKGWCK
ncbi:hypothetical protein [Enterobacter cancerogenus]|uniref:hypothetical protein n=1 Tax=Enterobacter cancerogenus TaxID=69218 RepID=UPI001299C44B|nr:hypothetical protein [Enterobacter cancerogenus]QGG11340.1 hypothetical protein GH771_22390 [Enterobacter cancerogenus]